MHENNSVNNVNNHSNVCAGYFTEEEVATSSNEA